MLNEAGRVGMKPIFLRGGQEEVEIEKIEYQQPQPILLDEAWYQKLLHRHPYLLLANKFDFEYEPISIGIEYVTTHGKYIDNLFVTRNGRIVLVEDKLIRNSSSRTVIAQAIDYAQDLQKWSYEDLDEAFRKQRIAEGDEGLFEYVNRISGGNVERAEFVGAVSKTLKTASFLILIAGDKIHIEVEYMADFLNRYTTMNFRIGLLELEVYVTEDEDWIVVPYLTMKTQVIEKLYVRVESVENNEEAIIEVLPEEHAESESVKRPGRKPSSPTPMLSDEELYSRIEGQGQEVLNAGLRDGIQGIVDDVRNNQLDGYVIKRTKTAFIIQLQSSSLVHSFSMVIIFEKDARFYRQNFKALLVDSGLDSETANRLVNDYVHFLEEQFFASAGEENGVIKDVVISDLNLLVEKKGILFAKLREIAEVIDEAVRTH